MELPELLQPQTHLEYRALEKSGRFHITQNVGILPPHRRPPLINMLPIAI